VAARFLQCHRLWRYLVARGVPFRGGPTKLVGGVVKTLLGEGVLLRTALERWQLLHPAFAADLLAAIRPAPRVVAARRSEGAPDLPGERSRFRLARCAADRPRTTGEQPPIGLIS